MPPGLPKLMLQWSQVNKFLLTNIARIFCKYSFGMSFIKSFILPFLPPMRTRRFTEQACPPTPHRRGRVGLFCESCCSHWWCTGAPPPPPRCPRRPRCWGARRRGAGAGAAAARSALRGGLAAARAALTFHPFRSMAAARQHTGG